MFAGGTSLETRNRVSPPLANRARRGTGKGGEKCNRAVRLMFKKGAGSIPRIAGRLRDPVKTAAKRAEFFSTAASERD